MGLFGNNATVTTTFKGKDDMSPVVKGIQGKMASFKRDAVSGFGLGAGIGVFNLAKNAIGDVVNVLGDAVNAAIEDQKATEQLNQTIRANVKGWDENTAAIEDAIKAGAQLAFTDDDVRAGLNQLIPRTKDIAEANRLNALAMDLARAKNMSLGEAATLVGKAYSGQVTALRRAGIAITNTKDKSAALAELQRVVSGQAKSYAKTTAGSIERMNIQMSEALESLGYALIPVATALADFGAQTIPDVVEHLGDLGTAFNDLHRFIDPNIASLQDLEFQIRAQATAMGIDADAAWAYVRAQQVQQSQDEEVLRLKQRLIDAGYDEATAQKMIADQLGEVGMYYNETTGEVERHATAVEEAADWLTQYNNRAVLVGGTLVRLTPAIKSVGTASTEAGDEFKKGIGYLPRVTMHAVVGMKKAIKEGKAGIVEQFRQLAWQSKHPFAQVNYENWLKQRQAKAVAKMKQAAKAGKPAVVEQYRQLVQDIHDELDGLPGYAAGIGQAALAQLAGIGPAVTEIMNGGLGGVSVDDPVKPRKGKGKRGKKAIGGAASGSFVAGEYGPEVVTVGSAKAHVSTAQASRGDTYLVIDGQVLMRWIDNRMGRQMALNGLGG